MIKTQVVRFGEYFRFRFWSESHDYLRVQHIVNEHTARKVLNLVRNNVNKGDTVMLKHGIVDKEEGNDPRGADVWAELTYDAATDLADDLEHALAQDPFPLLRTQYLSSQDALPEGTVWKNEKTGEVLLIRDCEALDRWESYGHCK